MTQAQTVRIQSSKDAHYATIERAMITAARAAKKVGSSDKVREILKIKDWASAEFKAEVI